MRVETYHVSEVLYLLVTGCFNRELFMQMAHKLHSLLMKFGAERPVWRQSELAKAVRMSPSALSRTLASLVELGFLRFNSETDLYSLGPTVVSLAGPAINQYDEFRHAYSEMHALMSETHLGVNLGIPNDWSVMYLMHIDGPRMKRGATLIGRHIPLHATALGKVVLGGMDDGSIRERASARGLTKFTSRTVTDIGELLKMVAEVRHRGYATELEELALSRGCIAVPVYGRQGKVRAAISISGPKDAIRLLDNEATFANLLLDASDRISSQLGYMRSVDLIGEGV